jgi:hypothetical protein
MEAASRRADGWIQLPCKEGTTVFELRMGEVEVAYGYHEPQYGIYEKRFNITDLPKIGKTIFLSHNEAKAVWRVKQYGDHSDRDCCW